CDSPHDILLRRDDGSISVCDTRPLRGALPVSGPGVGGGPIPTSWHIAGTGDFDGNLRDDILWRKDDGTVSIWDNGQVAGAHVIAAAGVVARTWHTAGTRVFDGN